MNPSNALPARLGLGALLLLSVFAWAPALYPGYWQGLDGFVPVLNAVHPTPLANAATAPDVWRGTGSAAFLLIQPLLFWGVDATTAVRVAFVLCFILGGAGIYFWLRGFLGDRSAGLAGLLYLLMPIFLTTVYVRGSLSDAMILAWLPLALAGLTIYAETGSLGAAALAVLSIVWMWRTQAGLALLATVLLLIYVLVVERRWLLVLVVLAAGAAGAVSLIPDWTIDGSSPVHFADHFVHLYQLFGVNWAVAPSVPGWQDRFPFQLGFAVVGFSAVALWGWWVMSRRVLEQSVHRLLAFAFVGATLLILASLDISAPLWQLSDAGRLLTYPWQVLVLAAPLLAVTAGALPALLPDLSAPPYWAVLVAVAVLSSYPYLTTDFTQVTAPARPLAVFGDDQLVVLDAEISETTDPRTAQLDITWQALHPLAFDDNIFFQAITGEGAGERVVAQLDTQPLDDQRPATSWRPGAILRATYTLDLSAAPGDEPLRYYFGFYNWQNGQRLPVDGGLDDKMVLHGK